MKFLELKVPPPLIVLGIAVIMYLVGLWMPEPGFSFPLRTPVAVLFAAVGIATSVAGVRAFRRHHTTTNPLQPDKATSLVTDGVFRWTRNPMYLGLLLALTGWTIWLSTVVAIIGLPLFVIYLTLFQILPEERALRTKFGSEWTRYQRHVRRWL